MLCSTDDERHIRFNVKQHAIDRRPQLLAARTVAEQQAAARGGAALAGLAAVWLPWRCPPRLLMRCVFCRASLQAAWLAEE